MVEHEGIVAVTNSSFEQVVLRSRGLYWWTSGLVVRTLPDGAPVLEQIASKTRQVLVAVDVAHRAISSLPRVWVQGIPALYLIKDKVVDEWVDMTTAWHRR